LYDPSKCVGCRACQNACKDWNGNPAELDPTGLYDAPTNLSADSWAVIKLVDPEADWPFYFHRCMHCTEASCVSVCPTGAAHYEGEFVVIDQEWCIGCGYCVTACPFGVPHLGHGAEKASARKCWFCFNRMQSGIQAACSERCPTGALEFGKRDALIAKAHDRINALKAEGYAGANLYGEKELGGLHHMSLLLDKAEVYGLPEIPKYATRNVIVSWLAGLVTAGVAVAVPFWWLFTREQELVVEGFPAGEASEGDE
jgi:formate dehydrogenase iron-sulfur subunit